MTRRLSLGCALLAILFGACQQRLLLDDLPADASHAGTGGKNGIDGGGGGIVGPTDGSSDARCFGNPPPPISFNFDTPEVVVALDRSSAMNEPLGQTSVSQLNAAINALASLAETYVPSSGNRKSTATIDLAFLDFPEAPPDCMAANGCCAGDITPTTTSQMFGAAENMCNGNNSGASTSCIQSKGRPIKAALAKAYEYFYGVGAAAHNNERFVLLVTDGDPSGCSSNDCGDAIAEAGALSSDLGVTVEVVAIGTAGTCLPELTGPTGMTPYTSANTDVLFSVLQSVTHSIAQTNCRLTIPQTSSSEPLTVWYGQVKQLEDGSSNSDTWSYGSDNTRIILHGALCESFLKNSQNSLFGLQIYAGGCGPDHFGQNP